jgi:protein transport protein SEC13
VWQLDWAHPRFGSLLASCGYDKKVLISREVTPGVWEKVFEYNDHKNSVNSISFAPQEYGLILLCGSSDGTISIHEYKNEQWISKKQEAHSIGVNSVCWGPPFYPITFQNDDESNQNSLAPMRFVSGGCDNTVKVWTVCEPNTGMEDSHSSLKNFKSQDLPEGHTDWVRDVAWLNYVGYAHDTIASCSEDETVIIWKFEENSWRKNLLSKKFNTPTWKVSWSHCGSYLAVSAGDNCVYLFKENVNGEWEQFSQINSDGSSDFEENK